MPFNVLWSHNVAHSCDNVTFMKPVITIFRRTITYLYVYYGELRAQHKHRILNLPKYFTVAN
jgi:hypothetical protein